jgi:nitrate reductase assembly molybdenum cofactor insertion protein NarJ
MSPVAADIDPAVRDHLREAAEWRLISLLFECPSETWRRRILELEEEVRDVELRRAAELAREQGEEGQYHSTFGPGGPAPAREASYRDTLQLGYLIAELNTFYEAFGYQPATREAADHVSVEAGFVGYLALKQAFAWSRGDREAAEVANDAAREFLAEHLSSIAEPLGASLASSGVEYLEAAGRALALRAGPARKRFLVLPDEAEDVFGC